MTWVNKYVEIEVSLEDFSDDEIKEEYEWRELGGEGSTPDDNRALLEEIYYLKVKGQDFEAKLNEYICNVLGRIV
jgi:hypothetical protein